MTSPTHHSTRKDARFARPLVGIVDPLGHLEVAGTIPAEEMGLRPRRKAHVVGTAYDPASVGEAYVLRGASPRYLMRKGGTRGRGTVGDAPTRTSAYQDRTTVRVGRRGEDTHVLYRLHEPELAGKTVAMVTSVERRRVPVWLALPSLLGVCAAVAVAALLMGWRDPHAVRGSYVGKTFDEIRADLDAQVPWDAMEISVAGEMVVEEGATTVEARLENVEANHCDQRVRIFETDDPSDVLFESGAIAPGEYVQFVELAHALSPGTHNVTVEFQGYERRAALVSDEGVILGHNTFGASCAAEVTIYCTPRDAARA